MNTSRTVISFGLILLTFALFINIQISKKIDRAESALKTTTLENKNKQKQIKEFEERAAEKKIFEIEEEVVSTIETQSPSQIPRSKITQELIRTVYDDAKQLETEGRYEEALQKYLWCYDASGMGYMNRFLRVVNHHLIDDMLNLSEQVPSTISELEVRRDLAEKSIRSGSNEGESVSTFTAINKALGDSQRSIDLYDRANLDDHIKSVLRAYLRNDFIEAQRYEDAKRPGVLATGLLALDKLNIESLESEEMNIPYAEYTTETITSAAKNIEALLGAGEIEDGINYSTKLLEISDSPETISLLEYHLTRAGMPELLIELLKKQNNS